MKDEQRIKNIEDEIKILKNEIKSILLDVREQYLNIQNPFNMNAMPSAGNMMPGAGINLEPQGSFDQPEENADDVEEQNGHSDQSITDNLLTDIISGEAISKKDEKPHSNRKDELSDMPVAFSSRGGFSGNTDDDSVFGHGSPDDNEDFTDHQVVSFTGNKAGKKKKKNGETSEMDLVVIAGLTQWIDQATAKLGKEKTEILIEMSFTMGHLPENIKDALIKMTRISSNDSADRSATASDYLSILAQLENLLAGTQLKETALLSILSMIKDNKNG